MIQPSCPVLVIHDDDAFRRNLVKVLDQQHFTVTMAPDGDEAIALLQARTFLVVLVGLDVTSRRGVRALEHLRDHPEGPTGGLVIVAEPNPDIRRYTWADETLLKPVDPAYVAQRARVYCQR